MPTPKEVLEDDNFWNLPVPERVKAMSAVDPNFKGLRGFAQLQVVGERPQPKPSGDRGFLRTLAGDVASIPSGLFKLAQDPLGTAAGVVKGTVGSMSEELGKAKEAFKRGEYVEAGGHGLAGVLPVIGPAAARAGEEFGENKPGEATAHAVELLAPFARKPLMRGAGAAARGAGTVLSKLPTGGVVQDVAGLMFPQVAHGISLVNRVRRIFGLEPMAAEAAAPSISGPKFPFPRHTGVSGPIEEPATPFPKGKGTGTKYGGPYRESLQAGKPIPRKGFTPLPEPAPPSPPAVSGPKFPFPKHSPRATEEMPPTELEGVPKEYQAGAARTAKEIAGATKAKVDKIVKLARDSGVDPNLLENATPAQRNMLAKAADPSYKGMSDETLGHVVRELRKFTLKPE